QGAGLIDGLVARVVNIGGVLPASDHAESADDIANDASRVRQHTGCAAYVDHIRIPGGSNGGGTYVGTRALHIEDQAARAADDVQDINPAIAVIDVLGSNPHARRGHQGRPVGCHVQGIDISTGRARVGNVHDAGAETGQGEIKDVLSCR